MKKIDTLKAKVDAKVAELQKVAKKVYGKNVPNVQVVYDLTSVRIAGQAVFQPFMGLFKMRLHEAALAEYGDAYIEDTVVHEFAHLVQNQHYPMSKPHGVEWKAVMVSFGVNPSRCHKMDLSTAITKLAVAKGIPAEKAKKTGRQRRWTYKCSCQTHELSTIRHNKVQRDESTYHCKKCKTVLHKA